MRKLALRVGSMLIVGALAASLVGAVGASARPASTRHGAARSVEKVKIVNFAFKPKTVDVDRGTEVMWTNRDSVPHTVTPNSGSWGSGSLENGDSFSHIFKKAGTFKYHCEIHPDMKGKVVVS